MWTESQKRITVELLHSFPLVVPLSSVLQLFAEPNRAPSMHCMMPLHLMRSLTKRNPNFSNSSEIDSIQLNTRQAPCLRPAQQTLQAGQAL